ncbi:MAG: hypothetical protein E5Y67_15670 [Mesorhizobium sp.]|uniref:hypothetical protein n=1 Tax=Mesorhizobium sp. TaxID=1871066 RepID=UPI00122506E2|nr:hypothetical protein [Mesorhizobium sp.]TIM13768.1 MAG: hypothetical protein E5Y67_15670 [Mesorhizobium sp.]
MSRKSVQRFCGNDMQKNNNLKRVAGQTRRASGRIVLPFQAICRTGIASQAFCHEGPPLWRRIKNRCPGFGLTARDVLVARIGPAKIGLVVKSGRRHFGGALG